MQDVSHGTVHDLALSPTKFNFYPLYSIGVHVSFFIAVIEHLLIDGQIKCFKGPSWLSLQVERLQVGINWFHTSPVHLTRLVLEMFSEIHCFHNKYHPMTILWNQHEIMIHSTYCLSVYILESFSKKKVQNVLSLHIDLYGLMTVMSRDLPVDLRVKGRELLWVYMLD